MTVLNLPKSVLLTLLPVIDCRNLDVSKFIVDTLTTGRETGVKDLMLVASGEYTVGVGGDYETFALALVDGDDVAAGNTLKFTEISAISGTQASIYNKKLEGTLIIDGQNYPMENSVDERVMTISPSTGSNGNIVYDKYRMLGTGTLTGNRALLSIIGNENFTGNIIIKNSRFNGNNKRYNGIVLTNSAQSVFIWRSVIVNCVDGTNAVNGIQPFTTYPVQMIVENCIIDNCYRVVLNSSQPYTYRNCAFTRIVRTTDKIFEPVNSTSINCATDQATVGAGTDTNPVVNINIANEFVNTNVDDLTNGYKCKDRAQFML